MEDNKPKRRLMVPPSFIVLTVATLLLPLGATHLQKSSGAPAPTFPNAELAALDSIVQARLGEVPNDGRFGMNRIGTPEDRFLPLTPSEKLVIDQLHSAGLTVYFYTAGRYVAYDHKTNKPAGVEHFVYGPVAISQWPVALSPDSRHPHFSSHADRRQKPPADLPSVKELTSRAAQILDGDNLNRPLRFAAENWKVEMVPVPGESEACLKCHNAMLKDSGRVLEMGDAMGAAIYVWKSDASSAAS